MSRDEQTPSAPDLPSALPIIPLTQPVDLDLSVPGSKSITNRALILGALAEGEVVLEGALRADDTRQMLRALAALGFPVEEEEAGTRIRIQGRGGAIPAPGAELQVGNAGTAMRFLSAFLALGYGRFRLDGTARMRERRGLWANENDHFSVIDTRQIADAVSSSNKVMTTLLGAVAGVSLLVGGIGIMNIMLVSVTERTREIGIRLAIGARAREVLLQFLVEAITLSSVGGVAGIALATSLCIGLSKLIQVPFLFDPVINLIAFFFSAFIGVLFGFMPARRAASLDPIDALRHE